MNEPENGAIVAWYDANGDPYVVLFRDDENALGEEGKWLDRWWFPVYDGTEDPRVWAELCADLEGFRGPVLLVPAGGDGS